MLVQTDINELGDKRLDPKESLAKIIEENKTLSEGRKIPNQARYENEEEAWGKPMAWQDLCRRLKIACPELDLRDGGYPNAIAVRHYRDNHDGEGPRLTYITGFLKEVLPEYSSVTLDEHGVAVHEAQENRRGWRTVIKKIYEMRCCEWDKLMVVFGNAMGSRAENFNGSIANPNQRREGK